MADGPAKPVQVHSLSCAMHSTDRTASFRVLGGTVSWPARCSPRGAGTRPSTIGLLKTVADEYAQ
jgi:hypothetical protein